MFDKEKKYFPVKTKTACSLKWSWSTLYLKQGETASCHRCKLLPIDEKNFDDFHNLSHKLKEREIMLQGKWPTVENGGSGHCMFCKKSEDVNELSDRQRQLQIPNLVPKELLENKNLTKVTPTILELYLNNTCNMKCAYCGPLYSSQWETELNKYGDLIVDNEIKFKKQKFSNNMQSILFKKTLEWIDKNGHNLKRLHVLGGEPFYQEEFKELLDLLEKKNFKNLQFNIISNLMTKSEIFLNYLDKIKKLLGDKKLARFDLTASIDNWGKEAEYARFGLKIENWKKLFEHCVKEKWIYLNINSTITCLTIRTLPELTDYLELQRQSQEKYRIINHFGGELVGNFKDILHPAIFGKNFWKNDFEKLFKKISNEQDDTYMKILKGVYKALPDTIPNKTLINKMKNYLDMLDIRRNTNWREVYPYLDI